MSTGRKRTPKRTKAAGPRSAGRLQRAIDDLVREMVTAAMTEAGGNVSEAARALGISRAGLWNRLTAFGLDADTFRR